MINPINKRPTTMTGKLFPVKPPTSSSVGFGFMFRKCPELYPSILACSMAFSRRGPPLSFTRHASSYA